MSEEIVKASSIEAARAWFILGHERVRCISPDRPVARVCKSLNEAQEFFDALERGCAATNEIVQFLHCGLCVKEKPANISPRDWAKLEVGWTAVGIQIWCCRHECNVAHLDFEGKSHPANLKIHQRDDLGL